MMLPPYAYACASTSRSGVASGKRLRSSPLMDVSHAESIIASCVSTEYENAPGAESRTNGRQCRRAHRLFRTGITALQFIERTLHPSVANALLFQPHTVTQPVISEIVVQRPLARR